MAVAEAAVRADHARGHISDRHAVAHPRESRIIVRAERFERAVLVLRLLQPQRRNVLRRGRGLVCEMPLARGGAHAARSCRVVSTR